MSGKNRQKMQDRSLKQKQETGRVIKDKFKEERKPNPPKALTEKQEVYFDFLRNKNCIVAEGVMGSGKSYCSAVIAADMFMSGEISKIIVARPYVQTGKTSGLKPGTTLEKLYPYVRNVLDTIRVRMGDGRYYNALKDGLTGQIEVQDIESIRGRSFDEPSFLIIEEAQQTSPEEMEAIVTRVSDNCRLVISGCDSQRDIKGVSGLRWFKDFCIRHELQDDVGMVNFDSPEDIVRGGFVKRIAYGLAKDNGNTSF